MSNLKKKKDCNESFLWENFPFQNNRYRWTNRNLNCTTTKTKSQFKHCHFCCADDSELSNSSQSTSSWWIR